MKRFFFDSDGFQPIYFWATIFCLLIASGIVLRFLGKGSLSDVLLLGLMAQVVALIGIFNWRKNNTIPPVGPQ
jgi:hypothetical protein